MKEILIIRPNHDIVVSYLFYLQGNYVIPYATSKGFKVLDFKSEKATKEYVTKVLTRRNPRFVIINGHGSHDKVYGHKDEELIVLNENHNLLFGKIVFSISCDSARTLGKCSVKEGVEAFVGYDKNFVFFHKTEAIKDKSEDVIAWNFLNPPLIFIKELLKGKSVGYAHDISRKQFFVNAKKFISSDISESGVEDIRRYLIWNYLSQKLYGDVKSRI